MKRRPVFLPPIWLALLLSAVGIVGMNLLYTSITDGGLIKGMIGALLLVTAMVAVGTPLAFARMLRKEIREKRKL
ncbi:hypothetical protein [Sporolactobacillus sp. KGMB 08714]|uniref:hypothetical protein n=1 Tax=Sporolactobacillus sp. KGMB 08714 TaxID=3064704 RepID=UPI002FBE4ECB